MCPCAPPYNNFLEDVWPFVLGIIVPPYRRTSWCLWFLEGLVLPPNHLFKDSFVGIWEYFWLLMRRFVPLNSERFCAPLLKDLCPLILGSRVSLSPSSCHPNWRSYASNVLEALPPSFWRTYIRGFVAYFWKACVPTRPPSQLSLLEDLCPFISWLRGFVSLSHLEDFDMCP